MTNASQLMCTHAHCQHRGVHKSADELGRPRCHVCPWLFGYGRGGVEILPVVECAPERSAHFYNGHMSHEEFLSTPESAQTLSLSATPKASADQPAERELNKWRQAMQDPTHSERYAQRWERVPALFNVAEHMHARSRFVTGFQLARGYSNRQFTTDAEQAGLEVYQRFGSWQFDPFEEDGEFLMAVLRLKR